MERTRTAAGRERVPYADSNPLLDSLGLLAKYAEHFVIIFISPF